MDVFIMVFLGAFGACTGSFLNVVICRLPRGESIIFPGSHCPSCGTPIKWYDNIPLVSWLVLRGRCRACKASISPRYLVVEAATAAIFAGLYLCYFVLDIRDGAGNIVVSWPMFLAHLALLSGLLVCSIVDIRSWIVPLEVCWFVSIAGVAVATARPMILGRHPFMPPVPPVVGAIAIGAAAGLAAAMTLQKYGIILPSFLDAQDKPVTAPAQQKHKNGKADRPRRIVSVAVTGEHGVNVRKEILRELLFLAPAILLAGLAGLLVTRSHAVGNWWNDLNRQAAGGRFAVHFRGFQAALAGYLVGGLWIWGTRILGTLAFGKEAMGLGDVHILAAVGAVTGWVVPTITFFVAPLLGLLWALVLWLRRNQRELPYGPWLAAASVIVMLFYDAFIAFLSPYAQGWQFLGK